MCASIPDSFHFPRTPVGFCPSSRQTPSAGGRIMHFDNQVVLVSGAGRGIGKEIALSFAREGGDIRFADVNEEPGQATANEIRKLGRRVFFRRTDVSDYDQVQTNHRGCSARVWPNRRAHLTTPVSPSRSRFWISHARTGRTIFIFS